MKLGCDISAWQGDVDFGVMKDAGAEFVICRKQIGYYGDIRFFDYMAGAKAVELEKIKLYTTPWKCSKEVWTRVPDKPIADRWHVEVYK